MGKCHVSKKFVMRRICTCGWAKRLFVMHRLKASLPSHSLNLCCATIKCQKTHSCASCVLKLQLSDKCMGFLFAHRGAPQTFLGHSRARCTALCCTCGWVSFGELKPSWSRRPPHPPLKIYCLHSSTVFQDTQKT